MVVIRTMITYFLVLFIIKISRNATLSTLPNVNVIIISFCYQKFSPRTKPHSNYFELLEADFSSQQKISSCHDYKISNEINELFLPRFLLFKGREGP